MKRLFLMVMAAAFLLSGCAKNTPGPSAESEELYDNSGGRMVLYSKEKFVPIAFSCDGENKIEPGVYWYYELEPYFCDLENTLFTTYNSKNLEVGRSRELDQLEKQKIYAVNGYWQLFSETNRQSFSEKKQEQIPKDLKNLFQTALNNSGLPTENFLITELWKLDFDKDGTEETFMMAEIGDQSKKLIAYVKGENCILINVADLRSGELTPLFADLYGKGKWDLVVFYRGDYNSFTVYDYKEKIFTPLYQVIF